MAKGRRTTKKGKSLARPGSQSVRSLRKKATAQKFGRHALPLLIGAVLIAGITFLVMKGYETAIESDFFAVRNIDIRGVDRAPADDIRKIVASNTEKTGVWRADLPALREKIEKLPFVKTVAVSMSLPSGIRVNVLERVPVAIVRLNGGDVLADSDGVILAPVTRPEPNLPFVMRGWDETKSEKAPADNIQRIKLYKKMLDEWRDLGLAILVKEVNLSDMREPHAMIMEAGRPITVTLAKDNLVKSLKLALDAVAGKGERVKAVNAAGVSPVLEYVGN
jgi:cell division septal protein FtsQ